MLAPQSLFCGRIRRIVCIYNGRDLSPKYVLLCATMPFWKLVIVANVTANTALRHFQPDCEGRKYSILLFDRMTHTIF
jgi:hypothetical protein